MVMEALTGRAGGMSAHNPVENHIDLFVCTAIRG